MNRVQMFKGSFLIKTTINKRRIRWGMDNFVKG